MAAHQEVVEGDPHRVLRRAGQQDGLALFLHGSKAVIGRYPPMMTVIATTMMLLGLLLLALGWTRWLEQR